MPVSYSELSRQIQKTLNMTKIEAKTVKMYPSILILDGDEKVTDHQIQEADFVFTRMASGNLYVQKYNSRIYCDGRFVL